MNMVLNNGKRKNNETELREKPLLPGKDEEVVPSITNLEQLERKQNLNEWNKGGNPKRRG